MDQSFNKIETLVIPISYLKHHLERSGKEIHWQGKLYDIKSIDFSGDNAMVKAIHDIREQTLFGDLSRFLKDKNEPGNDATKVFSKLLKIEFLKNDFYFKIINYCKISFGKLQKKPTLRGYPGFYLPPPQIAGCA